MPLVAKLDEIRVLPESDKGPVSVTKPIEGAELLIPMADFINKEAEIARLDKEIAHMDEEIARIEKKLTNDAFVAKAPEAVVAKEREKCLGFADAKAKLQEQRETICTL